MVAGWSEANGALCSPLMAAWPAAVPWALWSEMVRRNPHVTVPMGISQGPDYSHQPKHLHPAELHGIPGAAPIFTNAIAQQWVMQPSGEHLLPQVGNLPISSFSSSRGSPDSSDYGSGAASSAEPSVNEMLTGRDNSLADNDALISDLKQRIQQQIEYYFSAPNLARDTYLRSQMDADNFVLVTLIAGFNCVRRLSLDMNLVIDAIRMSPKLELDEAGTKVRQRTVGRSTVVIHDLPEARKQPDLEELFSSSTVKPLKYEWFDKVKNNWYVEFEDEEGAQEAIRFLREDTQGFDGHPIRARLRVPVTAGSVNAVKNSDDANGGLVAGGGHVPRDVQIVRPPGDMLPTHPYPAYAAYHPAASYYPQTILPPQMNPLMVFSPIPGASYLDMCNMLAAQGMYAAPPQSAPQQMYRPVQPQNQRGRGSGPRRGGGMSNYGLSNSSRRGGRGGSNPNSGRNSAMSDTRSEQSQGAGLLSQNNHQHSRQSSFSSVNGVSNNIHGVVSPTSTRSGSNSPPTEPEVRVAGSQTDDRQQEGRSNQTTPRKPKRPAELVPAEDSHPAVMAPPVVVKENQAKFDLVSTMFPPLPGQTSADSTATVSVNQPPAIPVHSVNLSAADVVRGIVNPKLPQQSVRTYGDSESSTEMYDRGRNYSLDQNYGRRVDNSKKKEQSSSTDDLPKSGRDHGQDGRIGVDASVERSSKINSSAGTQTGAVHVDGDGPHDAAAQNSMPTKKVDKRPTGSSSKKTSSRKSPEDLSPTKPDAVVSFHTEGQGELIVHSGVSPQKGSDEGSAPAATTEALKNVSVENGKGGSSTISYARMAQLNRDKLVVPSSGAGSTRGPPLAKQTSIDSSSQSQEDKRSVKHERFQQSGPVQSSPQPPRSPSFRDNRSFNNRGNHEEALNNGHDVHQEYVNGNSSAVESVEKREDSGEQTEDTEGFTEVTTKHKPVRHDRHFRNNGPMRYGGSN